MSARFDPAGAQAFSNLSHEFRNPLAVLVGYAELLRHRDEEEVRREATERILEAAERLSVIVDDLLTVFAIDSGQLVVEPMNLELEEIVGDAVAPFEGKSVRHSFTTRSVDGAWPRVRADAEHLQRVLTNLLLNACKYSPEGSNVEISVRRSEQFAEISVSDRGLGLTEEQLRTVFERFTPIALPEHPEIRSTGLELYTARRLVELLGGTISAQSEPGEGSTFTFTVPLAGEE